MAVFARYTNRYRDPEDMERQCNRHRLHLLYGDVATTARRFCDTLPGGIALGAIVARTSEFVNWRKRPPIWEGALFLGSTDGVAEVPWLSLWESCQRS